MIERYLDKHVWSKMSVDSEWWVKGFIVGTVMTTFVMWRVMK